MRIALLMVLALTACGLKEAEKKAWHDREKALEQRVGCFRGHLYFIGAHEFIGSPVFDDDGKPQRCP